MFALPQRKNKFFGILKFGEFRRPNINCKVSSDQLPDRHQTDSAFYSENHIQYWKNSGTPIFWMKYYQSERLRADFGQTLDPFNHIWYFKKKSNDDCFLDKNFKQKPNENDFINWNAWIKRISYKIGQNFAKISINLLIFLFFTHKKK